MVDEVYFDGDPATDSARRHLERVLKEPETRHRAWPWVAGSVALLAAWYLWPRRRDVSPADVEDTTAKKSP